MALIILLGILACVAWVGLIVYARTMDGEGSAPSVAALRRANPPYNLAEVLPPESSDIVYYWRLHDAYQIVNFTVDEPSFVEWARGRGWSVEVIAGYPFQLVRVCEPGGWTTAAVSDGYCAGGPERHGWWGRAVYDRRTARAYYERE